MIFPIIKDLLKDIPEPIIMEIGAHHCEDTLNIMRAAGHPEKNIGMFVFEPDPRNLSVISESSIMDEEIIFCPVAIGAEIGEIDLYQSSGNANTGQEDWTGSSSILKPKNHLSAHPWCKFENTSKIEVVTLDHIFEAFGLQAEGGISFIWADIQGAEGAMVQGGQLALKHTKYLYCEYSDHELYEGQMKFDDWFKLLPGKWELMEKYPHDVLLKNTEWTSYQR